MTDLPIIAAKLAQEVRSYGHCRSPLYPKLVDGKAPPCECRHCQALREWDEYVAKGAQCS